jgi:hypothetical protein
MRHTYLLVVALAACVLAGTWLLTSATDLAVEESRTDNKLRPAVPTFQAEGSRSLAASLSPFPSSELAYDPALPAPPFLVSPPSEVVEQAKAGFRKMVVKRTQRDLASASFFKKLSPEKQGKLVETIVENETDFMQRLTEAAEKREILSESDLLSLRSDGESAIKSVLGENEYGAYQQHAAAAPDRIILTQTTEILGKSLSAQSSRALSTLLAEERSNLVRISPQDGQDPSQPIAAMAQRISARAATVLTSNEEREALQQVLSRLVDGASKRPAAVPASLD